MTKGKFYFFRIVYALSACVGGMGIVIVVLVCYACRRRSNLKRKSSDQDINQGYDPDTEDVSVLYEEFDDRIKFIRNCHVVDAMLLKAFFAEYPTHSWLFGVMALMPG